MHGHLLATIIKHTNVTYQMSIMSHVYGGVLMLAEQITLN